MSLYEFPKYKPEMHLSGWPTQHSPHSKHRSWKEDMYVVSDDHWQ
jgi:hypothetical protein